MRIIRHQAPQGHPVPNRVHAPQGPFPDELFDDPEIIYDYAPEAAEDGAGFESGATAQNNFTPVKHYVCKHCGARVTEDQIESHVCEE
jgi:hypothetical protein